jgi:hypothetical protein
MQRQMIALAYLGSQCAPFHAADLLCPFIRSRVSGLMRFRDGSHKGTAANCVQISVKFGANLGESATETPAIVRQA